MRDAAPKVSVLLPAFNAEQTLAACLRSIQRQSEPNWECILLDDGSTDGTPGLAHGCAASDPRLRVLTHSHRGLVTTLNHGLTLCRGEFIARMDADDLMHRKRLEEQLALLIRQPSLAGVGCHVRIFPRRDLQTGNRNYEIWLNGIDSSRRVRTEAYVECPVAHPTLMMRREILAEFGYRDRGWPEDYDLILRLLGSGREIGMLTGRRLCWRHAPTRLSRTSPAYSIERFTACKAAFLADGFLAGCESYVLWGHGGTGRALRKALLARHKRPSHIVEVDPGRLGNLISGAPVVAPAELTRLPRRPIVVSVAGKEARGEIRLALDSMGFEELRDYICAA